MFTPEQLNELSLNDVRAKKEILEILELQKTLHKKEQIHSALEKACFTVMKKFNTAVPTHILDAILKEVRSSFKQEL